MNETEKKLLVFGQSIAVLHSETLEYLVAPLKENSENKLKLEGQTIGSAIFSSEKESKNIIVGSYDGFVRNFDINLNFLNKGEENGRHTDWIRILKNHPLEKDVFASGSDDHVIHFFLIGSLQLIGKIQTSHIGYILSMCFSNDGTLYSGGYDLYILVHKIDEISLNEMIK